MGPMSSMIEAAPPQGDGRPVLSPFAFAASASLPLALTLTPAELRAQRRAREEREAERQLLLPWLAERMLAAPPPARTPISGPLARLSADGVEARTGARRGHGQGPHDAPGAAAASPFSNPLRPSQARGAIRRVPARAAERFERWVGTHRMRAALVTDLEALVREAQASVSLTTLGTGRTEASSKSIGEQIDHMLGALQAGQDAERWAYTDVACDLVSAEVPSRLSDQGHGFPDGLTRTRPDGIALDKRTGRELGPMRRVEGGGYVLSLDLGQVEVRGDSIGTVMERARLIHEAVRP